MTHTSHLARRRAGLAALCLLLPLRLAAAPTTIPLTAAAWTPLGNVEFVAPQPQQPAQLRINIGSAELAQTKFTDGTIEYDVAELPDDDGRAFPAIRFRQTGPGTAEQLYLRPHAGCPTSDDCIQYAPVLHDTLLWDVYPQDQAGGPVHATGWNHVRLLVSGHRLVAYVNGAATPTLTVDALEGDPAAGAIQLDGPALYRNITLDPTPPDLPPPPAPAPLDPRLLRTWQLSPQAQVPPGITLTYADRPAATPAWSDIRAEPAGLINLTRRFPAVPRAVGALAWLKTTLVADRDTTRQVSLGWTRQAWVFVNGRLVFAQPNYYYGLASTRRPPDGRLSLANASFAIALRRGDNEIMVALDNFFPGSTHHSGWGLEMQLHDRDGLR